MLTPRFLESLSLPANRRTTGPILNVRYDPTRPSLVKYCQRRIYDCRNMLELHPKTVASTVISDYYNCCLPPIHSASSQWPYSVPCHWRHNVIRSSWWWSIYARKSREQSQRLGQMRRIQQICSLIIGWFRLESQFTCFWETVPNL